MSNSFKFHLKLKHTPPHPRTGGLEHITLIFSVLYNVALQFPLTKGLIKKEILNHLKLKLIFYTLFLFKAIFLNKANKCFQFHLPN